MSKMGAILSCIVFLYININTCAVEALAMDDVLYKSTFYTTSSTASANAVVNNNNNSRLDYVAWHDFWISWMCYWPNLFRRY